jgi:hypothetical protein
VFRTSDMVLIAVMVSAAAFTYTTKHDAEAELAKVRALEAQIRFEEETINVLKADFSLLTQPARLQRLAETFQDELQLESVEPYQFADIDELPARPLQIEDIVNQHLGGMADSGVDGLVTGGVVQ